VPRAALPDDHAYSLVSAGRGCYVAVEERVRENQVPSVLLFDSGWTRLGEVRPTDVKPGYGDWITWAKWDPGKRRLALSFQQVAGKGLFLVGIVKPPSTVFRELFRDEGGLEDIAWAGDTLVWAYGRPGPVPANRVMQAEYANGVPRVLHTDDLYGYIGALSPSPDGAFVAFDRRFYWPDRAGMWMLDLRAGTCGEVTYEEGKDYDHAPIKWVTAEKLLFSRVNKRGRWDIYEAQVRHEGIRTMGDGQTPG
jgi:hypothetical protein